MLRMAMRLVWLRISNAAKTYGSKKKKKKKGLLNFPAGGIFASPADRSSFMSQIKSNGLFNSSANALNVTDDV